MINSIMLEKHITAYKLSKESGIAYSTLSDIISGKTDIQTVSARVLYSLSKVLGVSMEQLYLGGDKQRKVYINNDGRTVYVYVGGKKYSYMGPKNLVGFRNVVDVNNNVISVDTLFKNGEDSVYVEEDYIDLNDICSDNLSDLQLPYDVLIATPGDSRANFLRNNALIISDNMAILQSESSSDDVLVEVANIKRNREKMVMRLKDYAVLYTDMSQNMQKRAIASVKENHEFILREIKERMHA